MDTFFKILLVILTVGSLAGGVFSVCREFKERLWFPRFYGDPPEPWWRRVELCATMFVLGVITTAVLLGMLTVIFGSAVFVFFRVL